MIEDSTEEFHTASNGGGGSGLPSPRRLDAVAPPALVTTTPWQEDTSAIQYTMMVPPWALTPRSDIGLSFE
jgi:hypothetical protein